MEPKTETCALKKISQNVYVFLGSTNVGIIVIGNYVYLIDSGPNQDFAKNLYDTLKKEFGDITIKAILNTHSHADHCGGNAWLYKKSHCEIWASHKEKAAIEIPEYQSAVAYGGLPLPEFLQGYYYAEPTTVTRELFYGQEIILKKKPFLKLTVVHLPGHYIDMIGFLIQDADKKTIFFAGDGIFGRKMLGKFWLPFIYDVKKFKESLFRIQDLNANFYVPSHSEIIDDIKTNVEFNMISVLSNERCIETILSTPHTQEQVLKEFADINEIPLKLSQFLYVGCTIRSYISHLYREGRVNWFIKDNLLFWKANN